MSKIKEALDEFYGLEYYERADTQKTRKTKYCNVCDDMIPSGSHHLGFRFYGEDSDWPVFVVCDDCAITEKDDLHLIKSHKGD